MATADARLILRVESGDQGTFGRLTAGRFSCFTGELPWRNNRPGASCVPEGRYAVLWAKSPRLGRFTYRLLDVPGRDGILIHPSNLMGDAKMGFRAQLLGCISLGERLGWMGGQKALLLSRPAVRAFEDYMGRKPFMLEVRHA